MPHKIYKCNYCDYEDVNIDSVIEHEKEHIRTIDIEQVKSDDTRSPATMKVSEFEGCISLTFITGTEGTRREYKYRVPSTELRDAL